MKKFIVLLVFGLLTGCFSGRSQPSQFYSLESMLSPRQNTQFTESLAVVKVQIPKHMDRPQIVSINPEGQTIIDEHNRWVEPLSNLTALTLTSDLSHQLPQGVVRQKTLAHEPFDYLLNVDITDVNIQLGKSLTLQGWWILRKNNGKVVMREKIALTTILTEEYADIAKQYSILLSDLAGTIAKKLK